MAERSKRCARCQIVKPWSDYTPRTRWEDGTVRNVQANCRECNAELCREWRERTGGENPDKRRARQRRWVANLDPERRAIRLDSSREWWRRRLGVTPDRYRTRTRPSGSAPRIPAGPFAAWLRNQGDNPEQIARRLEMSERRVRSLLNREQERVAVDTVDRALLAAGDGTTIDDLYPNELAA